MYNIYTQNYLCDVKGNILVKKMEEKEILIINDNCKQRIKPKLIRDVKTEAVLVFARTALERFFTKLDDENTELSLGSEENTLYVYNTLKELLRDLQIYVVNVEYLIDLVQNTKKYPKSFELRQLAKYEEPLINYYDTMAKRVEYHFPLQTTLLPEFIVVCVLSAWFLENEKPTSIYPFIEKYDFLSLIEKFEIYGQHESKDKRKLIIGIQKISIDIINILNNAKYKFNKERTSTRKKRGK